jgi:hypothetical protein
MKKQNAATMFKNPQLQESIIRQYKEAGLDFTVKHSNYNTQIIGQESVLKFVQTEHSIRVFIAYNKIVKDLKASDRTVEILQGDWSTENFDSKNGLKPCKLNSVLNLDITSAYPYCLFINKLITLDTFNYLMQLPKNERLPAIGMIAKKSVWIEYKKGDASSWELKEGDYANIFFFVINQITDLMAWAAEIAGSDFLFYWVDGIFLRPGIKKAKLNEITRIFAEQGYYYKYENVKDFSIVRDGDKLFINMIKNGEEKPYTMYDKNLARNFTKILQQLENEQNTLHVSRATA